MKLMRIHFVLAAVLVIVLFGSLHAVAAESRDGGLVTRLETDQRWLQESDAIKIGFSMTNTGKESVFVLRWQTPVDGIEHDIFDVRRDGEPVPYMGILAKRPAPRAEDYVEIRPGQRISATFDPSAAYNMAIRGEYTVRYRALLQGVRSAKSALAASELVKVASNDVMFWIEGRDEPAFVKRYGPTDPDPDPDPTDNIEFEGCVSSQQAILMTAHDNATMISNAAEGHLASNPNGSSLYTQWFGEYTSTRFDLVSDHYDAISSAFEIQTVTYSCACKQPFFAYVYPTQPYRIYVCRVFWQVSPLGRDSQAGTLVHEMSHFDVVANTDDYVYGESGCLALAISDPEAAVRNADSHEYFAEDQ